jgi:hypothetical protein
VDARGRALYVPQELDVLLGEKLRLREQVGNVVKQVRAGIVGF